MAPMDDREIERAKARLLDEIEADARQSASWTGRSRFSPAVMAAMSRVPRHAFMAEDERDAAYVNRPRSIGYGQTISQPFIVALMTDLLDLRPDDRVLEIGTGSGYQTAVLAEIAADVQSIETIAPLAETARVRLAGLGYANVTVIDGDGWLGLPAKAPFDAIIVTAAPERIPEALVGQLAPGGRMVVPVGRVHRAQMLRRIVRQADGTISDQSLLPVAFVPLVEART